MSNDKHLEDEFSKDLHDPTEEQQNSTFIQVGRFFQTWAKLESVMNRVIAGALNAKLDHWLIVTANLEVSKKIGIIRSFIAGSSLSDADKKTFDDWMNRIKELSETRNIIAHCMFLSHPANGGAIFYRVKADKKLEQIEKQISKAEFEKMDRDMLSCTVNLGTLRDLLSTNRAGSRSYSFLDNTETPLALKTDQ